VYDGNNIKIFINGVERASVDDNSPPGIRPSYTNLLIGEAPAYPGRKFDGKIDEVRVWNYARSEGEIQADMHRRLNGDEPGLVGYWRFDEGTGSTTSDSTANGNDGTLVGVPDWVTPSGAGVFSPDVQQTTFDNTDLTVTFGGYDADGDPLTAWVTQLPGSGFGKLYQYLSGGVHGDLITTTPALVTDPDMRVLLH